MNILYIAQRVPYPPNRGDKIASYNAVRYLARRHSVCVAALADSDEEADFAQDLEKLGTVVDVAVRRPTRAKLSALKALFTGAPLSVAYYHSSELARKIAARAASVKFDVVVVFSSSMGQYVDLVPNVPLVADFVDMDSRKWALYAGFSSWPRSAIYSLEERRLLNFERDLARKATVTLVRTEAEREDCKRLIPGARFEVLSNGVDLDFFKPQGPKPLSANIVFTGVMDYFPNVQAVKWFCKEVLPEVQLNIPGASFTIVGARPTQEVLALSQQQGVIVTGQVPDVRPYIQNAAAAVAPLLLARGVQNKVLEAMAMETPVVVTQAAFRGVDAPAGEGVLPAADSKELAAKVVQLLNDPGLAAQIGKKGRRLVENRYVWDERLAHLEALIQEAAPTPRQTSQWENATTR